MKKLVFFQILLFTITLQLSAQIVDFTYEDTEFGQSTMFINTSIAFEQVITVAWDLDGNGEFNDAWGDTVYYTYPDIGTYSAGLQLTYFSLTSDTLYKDVIITHNLIADFEFEDICLGDSMTLINTSTTTDSIVSLSWDFNSDGVFDDGTNDSETVYFSESGPHNVGLRVLTKSGILKALYKQVWVGAFPYIDFDYNSACSGDFTQFVNNSSANGENLEDFIWDFGDDGSNLEYTSNPSHVYSTPGIYNVQLIAISDFGCADTLKKNVEIRPLPVFSFNFSGDTTFVEGGSVSVSVTGDYDELFWSTGSTAPSITITQRGNYFAEISKGECTSIRYFTIQVEDLFGIVNLITPNGDGYNEKFRIFHLDQLTPCSVAIYNRAGTEVYSSNEYANDWDGTFNDKPLPEGTYYYIVVCNDDIVKKGPVTIIR